MHDISPHTKTLSLIPLPSLLLQANGGNFTIAFANDAYLQLLHTKEKNILYKPLFTTPNFGLSDFNGNTSEILLQLLQTAVSSKQPQTHLNEAFRVLNIVGNTISHYFISFYITPILSDENKIIEVLLSLIDNTEKILQQEKIAFQNEEIIKLEGDLASIEKHLNIGRWEIDLATKEVTYSKNIVTMCGYEPNSNKVNKMSGNIITHPEDRVKVNNELNDALENGTDYAVERRLIHNNGSIIHTFTGGRIITNKLGKKEKIRGFIQDTTGHILQTEEINKIKANQEALINGTDDLIWSVDVNMHFLAVNKAFEDVMFAVKGKLVAEGELFNTSIFCNDIADTWHHYFAAAIAGQSVSFQQLLNFKHVSISRYYHFTLSPIFNAASTVIAVACYAKDINESLQNILMLKSANSKLENIFASSLDVICSIDGEGNFLHISAASEKIWGYKPEEMVGQNVAVFIHPDDIEATFAEVPKVKASGVLIQFENRYLTTTKAVVHMSWTGSYQTETNTLYCVGRDNTEKKKYENALVSSKKDYQSLFDNNPSPLIIWDFETEKIVECNTKALETYGYTKDEFLQLSIRNIRSEEDNLKFDKQYITEKKYESFTTSGWCHKKKNGELFFIEVSKHLIDYKSRRCALIMVNDVTKKIEVQNIVQESETKYRSFFENSLDGILITKSNGQILDVNPSGCKMLQMTKEEVFAAGRNGIVDITDPNLETFLQDRQQQGNAQAILTHIRKDGSKFDAEVSSSTFIDANGESINTLIIRDITDRRIFEKELFIQKNQLSIIYNNVTDTIFMIDIDTDNDFRFISVNNAFEKSIGILSEKIIGQKAKNIISPTSWPMVEAHYKKAIATHKPISWEETSQYPNGTRMGIVTITPVYDSTGKQAHIVGSVRDVTNKNRNEEKIKESNERFKYVTKATSDAIWDWDLTTNYIYWGDGFKTIFGYQLKDMEPSNSFRINHIHPRDKERVLKGIYAVINGNQPNWEDNYRFLKADNTYAQIVNRGFVIRDKNGKAIRMVGAKRDISQYQYYNELEKLERNILSINEAGDKTLEEVLSIYLLGIEVLHPAMICSILQLQGNQLFNLASPSLPETYIKAIDGAAIGNNIGSCGTAAFTKQNIIVEDIQTDIRWVDYKKLAAEFGLRACWSHPILNQKDEVIATFATYYQTKKVPTYLEENTINRASNILKIILESYARTQALKESNERYNLATKATSDAIWDWNLENGAIVWGEGWQTIFGYDISTIVKNIDFKLINTHPEDLERIRDSFYNIIKSDNNNWEERYQIKKADGNYAHVVSKGFVIRGATGKAIRMVGATRDVTLRRQEELRLQLLESVIVNINDAVLITEAEPLEEYGPRIVYVNEAFTKLTGYTPQEVLGKTPRILQGPKSDRAELDKLKASLKKWESCEVTLINYTKSNEEFWVNIIISPVANEKGWFTHWVAIQRDITEKVLEEQNLTKAIIKAQENERYEIGGELHDNVCQILISSQLSLKMLKKSLGQSELAWYEKGVEAITLASREIRNLSHRLAPSFFNDTTLELAITTLIHTFNIDEKYELHILFDNAFKKIPAKHEVQINLYRIVQEQLKNIFKYANATVIEVIGTVKNGMLHLEIIDNGVGFNVHNVTSGIGIANMKRRTELFFGKFEVESELGKGCKMHIAIPLEELN